MFYSDSKNFHRMYSKFNRQLLFLTALLVWTQASQALPLRIRNQEKPESEAGLTSDQIFVENETVSSKFILITNGEQIKLFPLEFNDLGEANSLDGENYFLLKPIEFEAKDENTLERLNRRSNFTKWIQHKHEIHANLTKQDTNSLANIRQSILPKSSRGTSLKADDHDEDRLYEEQDQKGFRWKRPLITRVGYFVNDNYCRSKNSSQAQLCLVVVWLDKANKFLRFGSVDLHANVSRQLSDLRKVEKGTTTAPKQNDSILWLYEYPPIDLCESLNNHNATKPCDVYDFVVEKTTGRLTVIMASDQTANRVLTIQLSSKEHHKDQVSFKETQSFNEVCGHGYSSPNSFNLISPKWLYYLDKNSGKLLAMDVSTKDSNKTEVADQVQVFDLGTNLPLRKKSNPTGKSFKDLWPSSSLMSVDLDSSRVFFLMDDNQLYSTDMLGENELYIGKLSPKPLIRSPNKITVFDGSIFISDISKRSLMAYKLPRDSQQESSFGQSLKSTHLVLHVEMPTIQDFCIIDTSRSDEPTSLPCDDESKTKYSDQIDDEKLMDCFEVDRVNARLTSMVHNGDRSICTTFIYKSRVDGRPMRSRAISDCYSDIVKLSLFLIAIWLAYDILKMACIGGSHVIKILIDKIRLSRGGHEDMSAILSANFDTKEKNKCPIQIEGI